MAHPARTIPPAQSGWPGNFRAGKRGASAALRLKVREPQRKPIGSRGRLSPREDGAMPLLDHPPRPGKAGNRIPRGVPGFRRALPPSIRRLFYPATKNPAARERWPGRGLFNFNERIQ